MCAQHICPAKRHKYEVSLLALVIPQKSHRSLKVLEKYYSYLTGVCAWLPVSLYPYAQISETARQEPQQTTLEKVVGVPPHPPLGGREHTHLPNIFYFMGLCMLSIIAVFYCSFCMILLWSLIFLFS